MQRLNVHCVWMEFTQGSHVGAQLAAAPVGCCTSVIMHLAGLYSAGCGQHALLSLCVSGCTMLGSFSGHRPLGSFTVTQCFTVRSLCLSAVTKSKQSTYVRADLTGTSCNGTNVVQMLTHENTFAFFSAARDASFQFPDFQKHRMVEVGRSLLKTSGVKL